MVLERGNNNNNAGQVEGERRRLFYDRAPSKSGLLLGWSEKPQMEERW